MVKVKLEESYSTLLKSFKDLGYQARTFDDFNPLAKHVILRHDVDICLERALYVAEKEAEFGWTSIYYILLSSPFYNTLEPRNTERLRKISALGHEIGLHLELEAGVDLQVKADREAGLLSQLISKPIDKISFHRPTANASRINYKEINLKGYSHSYEDRFIKEIGYCSDSRGAWHYGHPLENDFVKKGHCIQLLTHPMWWAAGQCNDPRDYLHVLHGTLAQNIDQDMRDNFKVFD